MEVLEGYEVLLMLQR